MPQLVLPHTKYQKSYIAAVKEYQAEHQRNYTNLDLVELENSFDRYVQRILLESKGIELPEGYVPHTVYWLVEEEEFLGRVDIRHILNEFLMTEGGHIGYDVRPTQRQKGYGSLALSLAIEKAKELGLEKVLVTCDITNIGSNKIIQKNGGVLQNTQESADKSIKNRYWIENINS